MSTLQTTNLKNPSSGSNNIVLDSSGRVLVGTSTARSNIGGNTSFGSKVQIESAGTDGLGALSLINNYPSGFPAALTIGKTSGSTVGSNAIVSNGEDIAQINFVGADGTNLIRAASIVAFVDGTPGANSMPGRIVLSTTASGASSPTERFRISSDGSFSSVIPGGSTLYPRFGCRAWVNFNGTGTVAIRASGNVSSITDNGTGNYTVNFTTAMSDADYVGVFGCNDNGNITTMNYRTGGTKTTTAFQVSTVADGGALTDNNMAMVAIFR